MATLKQLRTRLKSMHSTRKITSAMKLVAASRWRRQHAKWNALKTYTESIEVEMLSLIKDHTKKHNTSNTHILIVCTPNKGLCGGYPANVKKIVIQTCEQNRYDRVLVTTEKGCTLVRDIPGLEACEVISPDHVAQNIIEWSMQGNVVSIIRGSSRNTLHQEAELIQFLPYKGNEGASIPLNVKCEPEKETLAQSLMEHALAIRWQCAHLGSVVAEEAARMSAMDQATRNADDAIALLQRNYNRMRQEKITTELVEMISGSALA